MTLSRPKCCVEQLDDVLILRPTTSIGELDLDGVDGELRRAIYGVRMGQLRHVIVDLEDTEYIGSNAVSLLIQLRRQLATCHGMLVLCAVSPFAHDVLKVTNLDKLVPVCASRQLAMDLIRGGPQHVLVVDDSKVDCFLAGELLRGRSQLRVSYASDGREALDSMQRLVPDLVLTDLVMPRMDGLDLVEEVRARFPWTPVILMTAFGSDELALEALERGAASFVPKAIRAERLLETVSRVLARAAIQKRPGLPLPGPGHMDVEFALDTEPGRIPKLVDLLQQMLGTLNIFDVSDQVRIGVALEEALINAVYHGNLEIGPAEWQAAVRGHSGLQVESLVERRRQNDQLVNRRVHVTASIGHDGARMAISDEGPGFDACLADRLSATSVLECGVNRGTLLMRTLMDEMVFNRQGNCVTLVKHAAHRTSAFPG